MPKLDAGDIFKTCIAVEEIVEKYLKNELPGQSKRIFGIGPSHSNEGKELKATAKEIRTSLFTALKTIEQEHRNTKGSEALQALQEDAILRASRKLLLLVEEFITPIDKIATAKSGDAIKAAHKYKGGNLLCDALTPVYGFLNATNDDNYLTQIK